MKDCFHLCKNTKNIQPQKKTPPADKMSAVVAVAAYLGPLNSEQS